MNANIDVVIPLYNGEKWIAQTLESVLSQSLKPEAIVVVDDGSTDNGRVIAERYSDATVIQNTGKGVVAARNTGFRHTGVPLTAFLD